MSDVQKLELLLELWERETLSVEGAIGSILQVLQTLQERQTMHQITLLNLRQDVDSLIAHTRMPPPSG